MKQKCQSAGEEEEEEEETLQENENPENSAEEEEAKKPEYKTNKQKYEEGETHYETESDDDEDDEEEYVGRVETLGRSKTAKKDATAQVTFNGVNIETVVDSGVQKTLLSFKDWEKMTALSQQPLRKTKIKFRTYGSDKHLPVLGRVKVKLEASRGKQHNTTIYIIEGDEEALLGQEDGVALGILKINEGGDEEVTAAKPEEVI